MLASNTSSSLDDALKIASPENIFYYGSKTMKKQSIQTYQRTNFVQALANKRQGQSVITLSPDNGFSHLILNARLPATGPISGAYTGLALSRGWLFNMIDYVQWRYGSSSLFQKSGQQLLAEMIATAGNPQEANDMVQIAGNELKATTDFANDMLSASCVIPLPHCAAQSATEVPNPFPSELLSAPIVITIAMKDPASCFGYLTTAPAAGSLEFDTLNLQARQIQAIDRGKLLMRSSGMAYSFPATFYQQVNSVRLANTAASQEVVLTGFRAGSCKGIHVWVLDTSETQTIVPASGGGPFEAPYSANPFNYVLPSDLQLSYAGNVIHNYTGASSSQLLDTLFTDVPARFQNSVLYIDDSGSPVWKSQAKTTSWVHFPLSQRFEQLSAEYTSVSGLSISNGVMNLTLKTPAAKDTYQLYYVPYYENVLYFHDDGNMDYVF
jgi:hypothetical protein